MNPILILMSPVVLTLGATAATAPAAAPVKTLANLATAWQGESNAKLRYELFAAKAESEGEKYAARLFRAAAKAEEIHAAKHAKVIQALGGTLPQLVREEAAVGSTKENLEASIKGETYEQQKMYPEFIEADLRARVARRAGQEIPLTNREFALLEVLAEASPRPVSKATLVERVWDQHFDSGINVLNVYINYLRKKIDLPGCVPLLQTLRGIGFALREGEP